MALVNAVVFQVVGFQNSGKTTFIRKLIETLANNGVKTAVIKHHGHGGKPDVLEHKDSSKHVSAGAIAAITAGDGRLLLQAEGQELSLPEQIQLLDFFHPDLILIEGHKFSGYPKVVLLKEIGDVDLLHRLTNIKAVIYWQEEIKDLVKGWFDLPCFSINDRSAEQFIVERCTDAVHKNK